MSTEVGVAKARYDRLVGDRSFFLNEAKRSAELTIPSVMPSAEDIRSVQRGGARELPKPYQSLGARGVNNLASKLLLTLLPPTSSFFRYEIDPSMFVDMAKEEEAKVRTDLQQALAKREKQVVTEVETQGLRVKSYTGIKHLLITGNVCLYFPPDGGAQLFPLNAYTVARDGEGNVVELVYVEVLDRDTVPEKVRDVLPIESEVDGPSKDRKAKSRNVELYTHVQREGDSFKFCQQLACGTVIPGTEGTAKVDESPWLVLRFTAVDGEDYGRSFVEEYRGDLAALETISKALQFGAVNAAKLVPLVNPNGAVKIRQLKKAENGEPIVGTADDVTFLRIEKGNDFNFAITMRQDLVRQLSADFLLNSSFQRPGERVTAEEIRTMAEELEDALGGVFSVLSQEFQLPLARRLESQLVKRNSIPELPKGSVRPAVVTGLAALGRGQDINRIRELIALTAEVEAVLPGTSMYLNKAELMQRFVLNSGVEAEGLLRTEEEVQAEMAEQQAQAQRAAMMEQTAKGAAPAMGEQLAGRMGQMMNGGQQAPQQ